MEHHSEVICKAALLKHNGRYPDTTELRQGAERTRR
jgi:hypothetical protein